MWILRDALDEDHSLHRYQLLGPGMKMFKLHQMMFKFHMMMSNKTIFLFQLFFSDPKPLESNRRN